MALSLMAHLCVFDPVRPFPHLNLHGCITIFENVDYNIDGMTKSKRETSPH